MKRVGAAALIVAVLLLPATGSLASSATTAGGEGTKYGAGVTQQTAVKVADLLASPDAYVGKVVRVDGVVQAVCQSMGCWIQLGDAENGPGVQFKVDDGVIVFPKDGKGRKASAEGTFEKIVMDAHEAEHARETMKMTGAAEAPTYRIKATGAVIY